MAEFLANIAKLERRTNRLLKTNEIESAFGCVSAIVDEMEKVTKDLNTSILSLLRASVISRAKDSIKE
jgi:hypothetical protein